MRKLALLLLMVLLALLDASEIEKETGDTFKDELDDANIQDTKDQQDLKQADDLTGDKSSDLFMSDAAEFVDDSKDLEELSKEEDCDASDAANLENTNEQDPSASKRLESTDQEKLNEDSKKQEKVKVVERGWRRRRRRRRRRPPPPPPPTQPPFRPCGSGKYNIRTQSCCFNRFVRPKGRCPVFRCGRNPPYNPFIKRCCYGHLRPRRSRCPIYRCGHYHYNPRFQRCCRRGFHYRVYNYYTHKCCYGIPIAKCYPCHRWAVCGWRLYSTWIYRCCANHLIYSHHFQRCCNGRVIDKEAICIPRRRG